MGKQKLVMSLAILTLFLFSFTLISAMEADNITIVTPVASGSLVGATADFNVTLVTGYEAENWTSVRIWLVSAGLTANTTEALATDWITNTTDLMLNGTLDSTAFEDGTDYTFKAQLFNGTDYLNSTVSGVIINNGVPTAPTLSPADLTTVTSSGTQTFTGTVVDADTTSCTYTIYRGGSTADGEAGTGSYSGTSCTFTKAFSSTADNGVWHWTIIASDGTDTTSTTAKLNVNLVGAGGGYLPLITGADSASEKGSKAWIFWSIIIVIAISLIAYFATGKKK